jgi:predicted unusual protein kinase regulating ubiquinone biosynthesis (AarF/ABC1/UbiB family)
VKRAHLDRYREISLLLIRHRSAVTGGSAASEGADVVEDAAALAASLEAMGPTFTKLGQVLSTRADLFPVEYLDALGRLRDDVEPFEAAEVERIFEEEVGARAADVFAAFDPAPMASASLGQVHRAELRDGRPVVVKVQRPDIEQQIVDDMDAIATIASMVDDHTDAGQRLGFGEMVAEFRRSILDELDYAREAANLERFADVLAGHERIVVPRPIPDLCRPRVLTMELVDGRGVAAVGPLGLQEVDGPALAEALFAAYLDQILVHGAFHADPHPGNVLITSEGKLALLDLGMVGHVSPAARDQLVKLLVAIGDEDGAAAAEVLAAMGRRLDGFDADQLRRRTTTLLHRHRGQPLRELQVGAAMADLVLAAAESGLRVPSELTLLGKALSNLDEVARRLDPDLDPYELLERQVGDVVRKRLVGSASVGGAVSMALEAKEFAEQLPGRVNKVMDALAAGELTLNIQGIDEQDLMRGIQKLANRLTAGIVVAALIIGAAFIMRIETEAQLLGYPALAIVMFLLAAAAGVWLLVSTYVSDLPQRHRRR